MKKNIVEYLKLYGRGKDNAITSKTIEITFGMTGFALRRAINILRSEGVPICSGRRGYYYAETYDDIFETISDLRHRIERMECAIKGVEGAVIND